MKKKYNIMLFFIAIVLNIIIPIRCATLPNHMFLETYKCYQIAKEKLYKEEFNEAIYILKKIKNQNILTLYNDKIEINLIYAYYKNGDLNLAEENIKKFISIHPHHPNIDYIMYMQSLVYMSMDIYHFYKIIPILCYKSDLIYAKTSFFKLKKFLHQYPNSLYASNAKQNLLYLKYRLSENDLKILKYYFIQKNYLSVIYRGEDLLEKYSETPAARKSLIYMKKAYIALKMFDKAQKISKIILLNHI